MVYVKIAERIQNFNLQTTCILEQKLLTYQNSHRWKKCLFLLFMHLSNCGKFVVVKQNILATHVIFHAKVPLLPEECDIIMCHTEVEPVTDEVIYQDFRVCRNAIQLWLEYFVQNHPTFHSHQVAVDYTQLDQLQC